MEKILVLEKISKSFEEVILQEIDLTVYRGEVIALVGPSGVGKTTMLQIIGLLDSPTRGTMWLDNINCTSLSEDKRTLMRRKKLSFVYQFHHLLPELSVIENVMLPQLINDQSRTIARRNAREMLHHLSLEKSSEKSITQLSGGEKQRVAIARGLVNKPPLLLADEPTGNLNSSLAYQVFELFISVARRFKVTIIFATHNEELMDKADRKLTLCNKSLCE